MVSRSPMVLWFALAGACSGVAPQDTEDTSSEDTDEVLDGFDVSGTVNDLSGQAVTNLFVTVSTEFCIPDRTDEGGDFTVSQVSPGPKRLITYGETVEGGSYASVVFAFEAEADLTLDVPVLAPIMSTYEIDVEATDVQTVQTPEGLQLQIEPGSLTLAPFAESVVQVARVPVSQAPPFVPDGVELGDLFVLHPIQSMFEPPAPVAFPADTGLTPGTAVTFHSLDYETGWLVPVAAGLVSADGVPETLAGEGISELTWVGLSVDIP